MHPVRCLDEGLAHYRASEMTRRTNTGVGVTTAHSQTGSTQQLSVPIRAPHPASRFPGNRHKGRDAPSRAVKGYGPRMEGRLLGAAHGECDQSVNDAIRRLASRTRIEETPSPRAEHHRVPQSVQSWLLRSRLAQAARTKAPLHSGHRRSGQPHRLPHSTSTRGRVAEQPGHRNRALLSHELRLSARAPLASGMRSRHLSRSLAHHQ